MTFRRSYGVAFAKIPLDASCLGRRLYNHELANRLPTRFLWGSLAGFRRRVTFSFFGFGFGSRTGFSGFSRLAWSMVSPILYMVVPQTEQTPLVVACPVRGKGRYWLQTSRGALYILGNKPASFRSPITYVNRNSMLCGAVLLPPDGHHNGMITPVHG
jgi:hypothetical protein